MLVAAMMVVVVGLPGILDVGRILSLILLGASLALLSLAIFLLYMLAGGHTVRLLRFVEDHSWYNMLPAKFWTPERDSWPRFLAKVSISTILFSMSFLLYLTPFVIIFYLAGEPFSTEPGYLILASFSALVVLRLARYLPDELPEDLTATLSAFLFSIGIIAGVVLLTYLGSPDPWAWLWTLVVSQREILFVMFVAYVFLDTAVQFLYDRKNKAVPSQS